MRSKSYWDYSSRARRKAPKEFAPQATRPDQQLDTREHGEPGDVISLLTHTRYAYWKPEHSLLRALLEEAQLCISRTHLCESNRYAVYCIQCDVIKWLNTPEDVHTQKTALRDSFPFAYVCSMLNLNPEKTRRAILNWHGGHRYTTAPQVKVRL